MKLYGYFRSSASYRVRIAMNLKGLAHEAVSVHLTRGGGEQFLADYTRLNPQSFVPLLDTGAERIGQSLAIMEYLDERYPDRPLLPADLERRAYVRQLALIVACDIHPLNNLRVLKYLGDEVGLDADRRNAWVAHWITLGFQSMETLLFDSPYRGRFCCGDTPTLADCCLVPQVFNARRFNVDLRPFPALMTIEAECQQLDAFRNASPERQPDAE